MKNKILYCSLIGIILLLSLSGCKEAASKQSNEYTPEDFYGKWAATDYITENTVTTVDFYPEKYIGNILTIEDDQYYMSFWEGIVSPVQVKEYFIQTREVFTIERQDYHLLTSLGIDDKEVQVLSYSSYNLYLGVIRDDDHMICPTGSGWYLYERMSS